ncbi:MAG: 2-amino-4-hydroxy-6-hydroxymethyldihydropteridine diphosphokinase [Planctomycetota bacterium]|nr:2-amino-4-hydroxy-6-hydroxymethyldihydropteridine diphosphokinase [Planctomycetota bacterium]
MVTCLIALGSNLGDRCVVLTEAIRQLASHPDIHLLARSDWFRTQPVGGPAGQGEFVNAAVRVETSLAPESLWEVLHHLEQLMGRQRRERWAARRVDLDLLLYGDRVLQTPQLTIPHPRMAFRRFVLEPAAQVAPEMRHPLWGWTIQQLREHLDTAANYIALTGPAATGKTGVARSVSEIRGIRLIADCPVGPASPSEISEPALLRRRADLLSVDTWSAHHSGAISDFWIGQSLAYARLQEALEASPPAGGGGPQWPPPLTPEASLDLAHEWLRLRSQVVSPKLIVLLQLPEESRRDEPPQPAAHRDHESLLVRHQMGAELHEILLHGQHGPVLVLNAEQPETVLAEVTAAWDAMR